MLVVGVLVLGAATVHRLWLAEVPGPVIEFAGETMGTGFVVKVAVPSMSRDEYRRVAAAVTEVLRSVNARLSTWEPESEISRFNRHASTEPFPASQALLEVMATARRVSERSGGAFDVTIRPLVQAWGFGDHAKLPGGPEPAELARLRERVGWHRIEVRDAALVKSRPEVVCDLSAIAKGYGVDAVAAELVGLGYPDHLVEVGGELVAGGSRAEGRPWRVAIEQPDSETGRTVHRALPLRDAAMATSGDYRNYYEQDGVRISHTIDPRTGRPVSHRLASVTVIDRQAMVADAWATALNVLGPEAGYTEAVEEEVAAYFIVREADGGFSMRSTPAFDALEAGAGPRP